MTIRCPQCETAYRVAPRAQLGDHPAFRCSRCDHVFDPDEGDDAPVLLDDDAVADDGADESEDDIEPSDIARAARPQAARFALRTLVGVTLAFTVLSIYLFTHAGTVGMLLAAIPIVGPDLAARQLDPSHIQLTDVRGDYARVQGDTLVFVISGTAVNNAAVPVGAIEIQGRIAGDRERRQLVFAGAAPRDVHELSEREIDLLQTLRPPKDWRLMPGQDGEFLVAFVDPPQPLREFSAEVMSVRRRESVR